MKSNMFQSSMRPIGSFTFWEIVKILEYFGKNSKCLPFLCPKESKLFVLSTFKSLKWINTGMNFPKEMISNSIKSQNYFEKSYFY
jgi:hypothetical protein